MRTVAALCSRRRALTPHFGRRPPTDRRIRGDPNREGVTPSAETGVAPCTRVCQRCGTPSWCDTLDVTLGRCNHGYPLPLSAHCDGSQPVAIWLSDGRLRLLRKETTFNNLSRLALFRALRVALVAAGFGRVCVRTAAALFAVRASVAPRSCGSGVSRRFSKRIVLLRTSE